ncbi:MAG: response regulator transcription factor [Bacteroidetes bacterium]|nr:MAG: response regulator transcription factor [Bacteroidota bacterium]
MKKIKIIIADDHDVVRTGLGLLLKSNPEFVIIGEAKDGDEVIDMVGRSKPDIILTDISMPKINGIELTRTLKQTYPELKILVFTVHENEEYVYQMIRAGANGYVLKNADKDELFHAIQAIIAGEWFFSTNISKLLIKDYIDRSRNELLPAKESGEPHLTKREIEILQYIAEGFTNVQIAEKLFLSVRTINTHRNNLMQKLNIHETASLVRYAMQRGIVKAEG